MRSRVPGVKQDPAAIGSKAREAGRMDLEPAKRGESIKPRVERSGTLGKRALKIDKPAKRGVSRNE